MIAAARPPRRRQWLRLFVAAAILLPCLYGFGTKFRELVLLYQGDAEGAFAIAPILNYLLASAGFLLLFGWAAANGMFHDIERPKHTMLENEALLDAQEASGSLRHERPGAARSKPRF
ncbi:MAG: hypothetical protein AB7O62_20035 [Pirellulales bacterium]